MKERPILFRGSMVRAILDGRKTQTRRIIKPQPSLESGRELHWNEERQSFGYWWTEYRMGSGTMQEPYAEHFESIRCRHGVPGDRLWVKENYFIASTDTGSVSLGFGERIPPGKTLRDTDGGLDVIHVSDPEIWNWADKRIDSDRLRPSIFMPRWTSRITLEITDVRVERVQSISEEDAKSEGISVLPLQSADDPSAWYQSAPGVHQDRSARGSFVQLWCSVNGKELWDANPWVWALTFQRRAA